MENNFQLKNIRSKTAAKILLSAALLLFTAGSGIGCGATAMGKMKKEQFEVLDRHSARREKEIKLKQDTKVHKTQLSKGTRIGISSTGQLIGLNSNPKMIEWIKPTNDITISNIEIPAGSKANVKENIWPGYFVLIQMALGNAKFVLKSLELGQDKEYNTLKFKKGTEMEFKEGKPNWALLSGNHSFGGKQYTAGSDLWFNLSGEVTKSRTKAQRDEEIRILNSCKRSCSYIDDSSEFNRCVSRCRN
ncbi:MAG: hypothetical protein OEZ34_09210 [Spirochaetia bacterium]|nr:hypothetical protein [Spirochaetia bacterium]